MEQNFRNLEEYSRRHQRRIEAALRESSSDEASNSDLSNYLNEAHSVTNTFKILFCKKY